jgi:hypothetical protein
MLAQNYISDTAPVGATLVDGGATFRVFAPNIRREQRAYNSSSSSSAFASFRSAVSKPSVNQL